MRNVDVKASLPEAARIRHHVSDDCSEVSSSPDQARRIRREALVNRLNFLHFQSASLTVLLKHRRHGRNLRLAAEPQPCRDSAFSCYWTEPPPESVRRGEFQLSHLEVPHGPHVLQVLVDQPTLDDDGISCILPDFCRELAMRRTRRHYCSGIRARILQNGTTFSGELVDFSATAFRLGLHAKPPQTFRWLDSSEQVTLILEREHQIQLIISGWILRRSGNRLHQTVVVLPDLCGQHRFPNRKHRSPRIELRPAPMAVFSHPLTGQINRLDVIDLSGSGFSVSELPQDAQLLPGMKLTDLELHLSDTLKLACQAQVVYTRCEKPDSSVAQQRSGLAILDMTITDHTQLMALLHRAENRHQGVSPSLDIDRLWEFFFDSGFIYPQKYHSFQEHRREFRETYAKLYNRAPEIARHFVYQECSQIMGHIAMLRTHSNTWLVHHHAADRNRSKTAGLRTMQLVCEAINESEGLYSSHMDYVTLYYRPENRFPHRVFGGVADFYEDRQSCSVDTLSYFHYEKKYDMRWKDSGGWQLAPAKSEDLLNLEAFYQRTSGGLMLQAMDLTPERPDDRELNISYEMAGFQRQQMLFALRHNDITIALFAVLRTEVGLNLSNLTNAITVIALEPKALSREAFFTAISMLATKFPQKKTPILVYPKEYAPSQAIPVEKHYNFWALDCRNLDPYFEFCNKLFNRLTDGSGGKSS